MVRRCDVKNPTSTNPESETIYEFPLVLLRPVFLSFVIIDALLHAASAVCGKSDHSPLSFSS